MTYTKLSRGKESALIIEGNNLQDGTIVAAELNGGKFLTRTHEVLNREENARFTLTAIGEASTLGMQQRLTDSYEMTSRKALEMRRRIAQKLGGAGLANCIDRSFVGNQFEVVDPIHLPVSRGLTERQQQILHLYAQGLINEQIANRLHIHESRVAYLRDDMFKKLGTSSIYSSVTVGHLAGVLKV